MTETDEQTYRTGLLRLVEEAEGTGPGPFVIPAARRLSADLLTPVAAFLALRRHGHHCFLFESVEGGEKLGRYSFLGRNPYLTIRTEGEHVTVVRDDQAEDFSGDTFDALHEFGSRYLELDVPGMPRFTGGAVGFLSYDTIRLLERLPSPPEDELNLPDALWCFYDTVVAFDHVKHQIVVMSNLFLESAADFDGAYERAVSRMDEVVDDLAMRDLEVPAAIRMGNEPMASNFERDDFLEAVRKAKRYIVEGDIFQVVLSQRFSLRFEGDDFNLYRALRQVNPSPYLFYLHHDDYSIVGSSPEPLVRVVGRNVETLPIAGTRPRGVSEELDRELEEELIADPKERAEHVMLVDLGRNDLSRVCASGSVAVAEFAYVERFSHVMHIVSSVTGILEEGADSIDALKACFPAGTVSGAPKVRAMEIIDELEPSRRGVYAGAVGYLDFSGNLDTCIAIRTMVIKDQVAHVQAGAGIVADSQPEAEYEETVNKARALDHAIRMAAQNLL